MSDDIVFNQLFSEFLEKLIENQETTKELLAELLYRDIVNEEKNRIQRGEPKQVEHTTSEPQSEKQPIIKVDTSNITSFLHDFLKRQKLGEENLQPYFDKLIETVRQNMNKEVFLQDTTIPLLKNILDSQQKHTALVTSQHKENLNMFTDLFEYRHIRKIDENNEMLIRLLTNAKESYQKKNTFDVREDTEPKDKQQKKNILDVFRNKEPKDKQQKKNILDIYRNTESKTKEQTKTENVSNKLQPFISQAKYDTAATKFRAKNEERTKTYKVVIDVDAWKEDEKRKWEAIKSFFEKMYNLLLKLPFSALANIPAFFRKKEANTQNNTPHRQTERKYQDRGKRFSELRKRVNNRNVVRSFMRALRRDPVFNLLNDTLKTLKKMFNPLIKLLEIFEPLKRFLQLSVVLAFPLLINFVKDLPNLLDELKEKLFSFIPEENLKEWIKETKDGFNIFYNDILMPVGAFLQDLVMGSFKMLVNAIKLLNDRIQKAGEIIGEFIGEIQSGSILDAFKGLVTNITKLFKENFTMVISTIMTFVSSVLDKLGFDETAEGIRTKVEQLNTDRPQKQVFQKVGNVKIEEQQGKPGIYRIEYLDKSLPDSFVGKKEADRVLKEQTDLLKEVNKNLKELNKQQKENNKILHDKDLSVQVLQPTSRGSLISKMPRTESR